MNRTHDPKNWKKIVYVEPGRPAIAVSGELTEDGEFFKILNEHGEILIARKAVICIKNAKPEAGP
jgi:hypothetical protein